MTCLLILGCAVLHVWEWTTAVDALRQMQQGFGVIPADVHRAWAVFQTTDGRWASGHALADLWLRGLQPFLTYTFLHAGPVHLLGNLFCLFVLGSRLEGRSSWWRFLLFFLLCGALAGVAQCLWYPSSTAATIGASGAIFGVVGGYAVYGLRARILVLVAPLPLFVEVPFLVLAAAWALLQLRPIQEFLMVGGSHPVAQAAHLGGLGAGVLLSWMLWTGKGSGYTGDPRHARGSRHTDR